jgi:cyclase
MGLAKRVIPCLDVTAGRVVKGVKFLELRDAGDPVEIAARYDAEGADELTFLDITASSDQRDIIWRSLSGGANLHPRRWAAACASKTRGCRTPGPTRSRSILRRCKPGARREASGIVGNQCIVVAIDAKKKAKAGEVYTHGGRNDRAGTWWIGAVQPAGGDPLPAWTGTAPVTD